MVERTSPHCLPALEVHVAQICAWCARRGATALAPARALAVAVAVGMFASVACERADAPLEELPPSTPTESPPSEWIRTETGAVVAFDTTAPEFVEAMAAAEVEAHRTLHAARELFDSTAEADRHRWAIKWAAPIRRGSGAGATERVWVVPIVWTKHRVEGRLANAPVNPIGAALGELVGFPTDEIADWMHMPKGTDRRDGGFTIEVLERFAGAMPREHD